MLYLISYEEERTVKYLTKLSVDINKKLILWSNTEGLHSFDGITIDKKAQKAHQALEYIENSKENAIFVLKDFHYYLDDANLTMIEGALSVRRKLRDLVISLKKSFKTVIFLSPVLKIPSELEKDIVVYDIPLPSYNEIELVLDKLISDVNNSNNLNINIESDLKERFIKSAQGLTYTEISNVYKKAIVNDKKFTEDDISLIINEKKQILRKTGLLEYYEVNEKFGNVGGLSGLKQWLKKRSVAFSDNARKFGLPEPKGILLLGVQGCGKSLVSKAISALWKLPLLRFDVGSIFGSYIGQSEENMRKALKTAESLSPCILWMDEIEKGLSGAGGGGSDSGVTQRVFGSFITWMQEKSNPVFIIASANSIENLPPELLRKGRFDEIFFVDLPTFDERIEIIKIHIKKRNRDIDKFNINEIAEASEGFSGAEIEEAVISSLYDAFYEKRDITTEDIVKAVKETVPLSKTMAEKITHLRNWAKLRARPA
jgi:SpoVK/Ycf46/Vps4 family AAA+-type ATPase